MACVKKIFQQFKVDERILNSKKLSFADRVVSLVNVWGTVSCMNICECTIDDLIEILEWIKLHTLNIIFTVEWNDFAIDYRSQLQENIESSKCHLAKVNFGFVLPCDKLLDVLNNPWQHDVLLKIFKNKERCSEMELIDFFRSETAYLTSVRLMMLCRSLCEDMASNLASAFLDSFYLSCATNEMIKATHAQVWFIFDVFVSLLYKHDNYQKMYEMLRGLTLEEGLNLVKRFVLKKPKKMKIWKLSAKIAKFASQLYISQMAFEFTDEAEPIFKELITVYYTFCKASLVMPEFVSSIRRITDITTKDGLHRFCEAIQYIGDFNLRHFLIEMYIKVITTNINECEVRKHNNDMERVDEVCAELAESFCKLSKILDNCVVVARECVLTAFSLKPTEDRLKKLETFAIKSGIAVEPLPPWSCRFHPPVLKSDEVMWLCGHCGNWMTKLQLVRPPENNIILQEIFREEVLQLPQTLCDDLSVCIAYSRYQILSWYQPWSELHRLCVMYLRDPIATKNFITELKYVDIDYSMFRNIKREPLDEWIGPTIDAKEPSKDKKDSGNSKQLTPSLKEFIVKLKPVHITADMLKASVTLKREKKNQNQIKKEE